MKDAVSLKWIIKNAKKYFPLIVLDAILEAVISVVYIALAYVSSFVLDIATGQRGGNIYHFIALLFFLILLQIVLHIINSSIKVRVAGKLEMHLKSNMFNSLIKKNYKEISALHSGDILNRFTSDIDCVVSGVVSIVPSAVGLVSRLVAALVVVASFSTPLVAVILVVGLVVAFAARTYSKFFKNIHKQVQEASGNTRSFMQECTENIVVVKTYNSGSVLQNKLTSFMKRTYNLMLKRNLIRNIASIAIYLLFTGGYYAALSWGAFMVGSHSMTYGTLTAMLSIVAQIRGPITSVSSLVPQYFSALASAERIMELENLQNEPENYPVKDINNIYENLKDITFKDVCFSYDGKQSILNNCNMVIEKGQTIALVGGSGEGKSTIFKQLLGLYGATDGSVYLNASEKIEVTPAIRGIFAYVPQGNMILSGSIRDNVTFLSNSASEEDVIEAVKCADLYDFISTLPNGLDTVLGERGSGLSEGQAQRIAIARAILSKAPILLLDECTSALDEKTEKTVLNNIKALKTKTTIIITHRPQALKLCNKIYRIENGVAQLVEN